MDNKMEAHYKSLAANYDEVFDYFNLFSDDLVEGIERLLVLKPSDILADIGGGTGKWSDLVKRRNHLLNNIICVDPVPEMTALARTRPGVTAVTADAHSFLDLNIEFNKCMIVFCIHHITERTSFFKKLREQGVTHGLIIFSFGKSPYYWFENDPDLMKTYETKMANLKQTIKEEIKAAGWPVIVEEDKAQIMKLKFDYVERLLRQRAYSTLWEKTDAEIQDMVDTAKELIREGEIVRENELTFLLFKLY